MKKIVTLLSLLIAVTGAFAQKGKVTSALSYKESGELKKAYESILVAIDPNNPKSEGSIGWPRSYQVKGEILQEIHRTGVKDIVDEPIFESFESFKKAIELDVEKKYSKALVVDLTFLQTDLSNYAISCYESKKFDKALKSFECYLEISNFSIMKPANVTEVVDTAIIYNAGLVAYKAELYDKAIGYFKKSADNNYNGAVSYFFIYEAQQIMGDTLSSLNTLKEGFEKYPDNENIMVALINYYISKGKSEDAIAFIDLAISKKPDNVSLYTAKGSSLEKLGREEDALAVYNKAIEIDATQFTPYYNIGVIHFNRGVKSMNDANQLPTNATQKQYDDLKNEGLAHIEKARPYLEKAFDLDNKEIAILETLRLIYYRLQMNDKYEEMNTKIQNLKK